MLCVWRGQMPCLWEREDALFMGEADYMYGSCRGFFYAREHYAFFLHVYLIDINIINFIFNICS